MSKVEQLENGNIRIFVQNSTNLQIFSESDVWKRVFLANATKAMQDYGVVAAVTRNPRTVLKYKHNDHQRTSLFKENTPRLTAFNGPCDIKRLRWLRKNRGRASHLLIDFATPELANEVIKQGFTWTGVTHRCVRYVSEARMRSCDNCLAFGHDHKQCNAKPRCYKCGASHASSLCSSKQSTCPACFVEHSANFRCLKRFTEQRDYRLAIVRKKPYYRVYADRDDAVIPVAANRICSRSPSPSKSANQLESHINPSCEERFRASITGRPTDQTASSESEGSSDTGRDQKVDCVQSRNLNDVPCNATTIGFSEQRDSSDSEQTSGTHSEQVRKEEGGIQSPVEADAVATLGKATDSSSLESTDEGSETESDCGVMSEAENKQLHDSADVSNVPDQVGGSPDHQKASKILIAHEGRRELIADRSTALTNAFPTALEEQIHSSKPTMILGTEPEGGIIGNEVQAPEAVTIDAVSTSPNLHTTPSGRERMLRPGPNQCVGHGEKSKQNAVPTDAQPAASLQPTKLSEYTRIRQSRPEDEDERYGNLEQDYLQIHTPAIGPPTSSSEVDLNSIPLPDDTEAIIRQLERLKAIVLARNELPGRLNDQVTGAKRKASEPLGPLSENSRIITPKRVKQEMPAEEDPVQRYIRENNCIPYPPENRYGDLTNVRQPANKL